MSMTDSPFVIELVRKLLVAKLASPQSLKGCSEKQIIEIEQAQGVKLPALYKGFLSTVGLGAGQLLVGSDFRYPDLLSLKKWAQELLVENNQPLKLPEKAFVFYMHQGYQFDYFDTADVRDDPVIFHFYEGESAFKAMEMTFSEFVFQGIEDQRRIRLGI